MKVRTLVTRLRHLVFGKPLTHEEAQARHEAAVATMRSGAGTANGARSHSVQSQSYLGM
jgi:hypothetical protein